ncbi:hypothetical protein GGR57DRAFT_504659 [Xylariaceae sp. FL1272]|nr:hypothetical protein GGR57DRAFT_504659 [Xylariaceae sp. FL1272]
MRPLTVTSASAALLASLASAQADQDYGNCTQFNWNQQPAYIVKDDPQAVSGAEACPQSAANGTCYVTAKGDAQFSWSTNVTGLRTYVATAPVRDVLVDAINAAASSELNSTGPSPSLNYSVIAAVDQTRILAPGQAAYLNFTAYQFCFAGTLANCTGTVEDGTPVEGCAPLWRQTSPSAAVEVDGEYTLVNISADDVDQYTDPFKGQSSGEEGAASDGFSVSYALLSTALAAALFTLQ